MLWHVTHITVGKNSDSVFNAKNWHFLIWRSRCVENHPKFRILILTFSTNFCPIEIDMSGNTV